MPTKSWSNILEEMESQYPADTSWNNSPHQWILTRPSATKGAIARQLVKYWSVAAGRTLESAKGNAPLVLENGGVNFAVRSSTLWTRADDKSRSYTFQQFRNTEYDHAILLGIAPYDLHLWIVPRQVIDEYAVGQHTGAGAKETKKLEIFPDEPFSWLQNYGGTFESAMEILQRL